MFKFFFAELKLKQCFIINILLFCFLVYIEAIWKRYNNSQIHTYKELLNCNPGLGFIDKRKRLFCTLGNTKGSKKFIKSILLQAYVLKTRPGRPR